MDKNKIKEKLETIDHLLYFTFQEERDLGLLRSIIEELSEFNEIFMERALETLKRNGKIKLVPKLFENKKEIYLRFLKEEWGLNDGEIKLVELLFKIKSNKLLKERFVDFNNAEKFYKLIQKLYYLFY